MGATPERDDRSRALAIALRDAERDLELAERERLSLLVRRRQPRLDEAKGDRVYVDLQRPPLAGEGLRDPDEAGLARGVVDLADVALRAGDRGHVDDLAEDLAALLEILLRRFAQGRRRGAEDAEGDDGVDLEHRADLVVAHVVCDPVPRVARVVHDDVEPAELGDGLLDERFRDAVLREVAAEDRGLTFDLAGRLRREIGVEVVHEDPRSLGAEELRGRTPDTPGRTRDDRGLALQHLHPSLLARRSLPCRNPMSPVALGSLHVALPRTARSPRAR